MTPTHWKWLLDFSDFFTTVQIRPNLHSLGAHSDIFITFSTPHFIIRPFIFNLKRQNKPSPSLKGPCIISYTRVIPFFIVGSPSKMLGGSLIFGKFCCGVGTALLGCVGGDHFWVGIRISHNSCGGNQFIVLSYLGCIAWVGTIFWWALEFPTIPVGETNFLSLVILDTTFKEKKTKC